MSLLSRPFVRTLAAAALAFTIALVLYVPGEAHKAITSKFTFNEDLFPLFRERCGRCHVDGGVAPMSLLTHDDAAPWAESLRLEFLSEEPPPAWHPLKLTSRELDMMLVWANGGTPRGDVDKTPPAVTLVNTWPAGPPDVPLPMPAVFTLAPAVNEATNEVTLPIGAAAGREIAAIDVLPGNPAIVRSATLLLKTADGATTPLGSWLPGQTSAVALAAPLKVPAGASIVARIDYKRTWKYEGQALADTSTVGLYTARAGAKPAAGRTTPRAPGR